MNSSPRLALMVLAGSLVACGGDDVAGPASKNSTVVDAVVSPELLSKVWPVRLADNDMRAPFEADRGWMHLFKREYPAALKAFGRSKNAGGTARMHLEYGLLYRQAALLAANSTVQAYGVDKQETDPLEMAYMVAVSEALLGKPKEATASMALLEEPQVLTKRGADWSALWAKSSVLPDNLEGTMALSASLGPVVSGGLPEIPALPHFEFVERTEKSRKLGANDPVVLLAIAQWHDAALLSTMPEAAPEVLNAVRAPWLLPSEPSKMADVNQIDDSWLFGRSLLCSEDVAFVAALQDVGPSAMDTWVSKSPLAAALAPAWDGKAVDTQIVMDGSLGLMRQVQAEMAKVAGEEASHHRSFALFARLGVLFAGQELADAAGQYRDAGILRLDALERMAGGAGGVERDPVFALSVGAWDAGNRNPLRPEDIVHELIPEFPGIEAARAPLDALHLRRSRNAAPSSPVH